MNCNNEINTAFNKGSLISGVATAAAAFSPEIAAKISESTNIEILKKSEKTPFRALAVTTSVASVLLLGTVKKLKEETFPPK